MLRSLSASGSAGKQMLMQRILENIVEGTQLPREKWAKRMIGFLTTTKRRPVHYGIAFQMKKKSDMRVCRINGARRVRQLRKEQGQLLTQ